MQPGDVIGDAVRFAEASEITVDRELVVRNGLWEFAKLAWPEIEADPLVPSWHMEQICAHLEAVTRGDCRRLVINVPPGCTKSTLVSVLWPAWEWILDPACKWMFATFDASLALRDAMRTRSLVRSEWYQARWGERVQIDDSGETQDAASVYSTTAGGRRVSVTVAGKATGWHAKRQVIDDPTKAKDILGDPDIANAALERTWSWFKGQMASRRSNPKSFSRVIIMQRLHENDLVGRIMEEDKEAGDWTILCLPMRFEAATACKTPYGGDVRTVEGELLAPDRFDEAAVKELEKDLGSQAAAAQLQQRPSPAGGNILQREWFKERWTVLPAGLMLIQSWDCTFKDKATSDFVAGHVWGYVNGKYYLIDRIHDRMGMPAVCTCIKTLLRRFPRARGKLIEDKANGPAVEQTLRGEVSGIIMVEPMGGKVARANAIAPLVEAGNVVIPDAKAKLKLATGTELTYEWADDLIEELVKFPFARHDDDMDAMSQAVIYLHDHMQPSYVDAVRKIAAGKVKFTP